MKPLFACFSHNMDYALGWMVVHSLWQATLIALVSGIVMIVLRKRTAKLRYNVANVSLLLVLVAALATFAYYYDFSKEPGQVIFVPESESVRLSPTAGSANPALETGAVVASPLSMEGFRDYFNKNLPLIVTVWVLGVALFMLRLLGGISYLYYLRSRMNFPPDEYWLEILDNLAQKAGLTKGVELVESALTRTPMVVGHLKPLILFPMGVLNRLSTEEVEAILAHELAHVLRNDYIFNILQSIIEALFYYHPAVWWLSAQVRNERESACDEIAISLIGNKMNYARALVAIQEMAYFPLTPALAFAGQRKSQLLVRVQRILNQPQTKSNVMEKLIATVILMLTMIGLSFSNPNFGEKNNPSVSDILSSLELNQNLQDSLPRDVKDGTYNYSDNTQSVELKVKEGKVAGLNINGMSVPEMDLSKFDALANKIVRSTPNARVESPVGTTMLSEQEWARPNTNRGINGTVSIGTTPNNEMVVGNSFDGSRTTVKHGDDGSQIVTTINADGSKVVVTSDLAGNTIVEEYSRDGRIKGRTVTRAGLTGAVTLDKYSSASSPSDRSFSAAEDPMPAATEPSNDLEMEIDGFRERLNDLRSDVKNCQCQSNIEFRKGLMRRLDALLGKVSSDLNEKQLNKLQTSFDIIEDEWNRGECEDGVWMNNNGNGASNNWNTTQKSNGNRQEAAIHGLMQDLLDMGYASFGRRLTLSFSNRSISVVGQDLSNAEFSRLKANFERRLGKSGNYSISFAGQLKGSNGNLSIQGALNTTFGN